MGKPLRELLASATPGPWHISGRRGQRGRYIRDKHDVNIVELLHWDASESDADLYACADLIVRLHEIAPLLIEWEEASTAVPFDPRKYMPSVKALLAAIRGES